MFNVNPISFESGQPQNGYQTFVMQSAENTDQVIKDFEANIGPGVNPNVLLKNIMDYYQYTSADFTDTDMEKINRKVEKIANASANYREYYA